MSFTKNIFKRSNVQSICNYLLYGCESDTDSTTYENRLTKAHDAFMNSYRQYSKFSGDEHLLSIALNNLLAIHEQVYMEIGMQAGFSILASRNLPNIKCTEEQRGIHEHVE